MVALISTYTSIIAKLYASGKHEPAGETSEAKTREYDSFRQSSTWLLLIRQPLAATFSRRRRLCVPESAVETGAEQSEAEGLLQPLTASGGAPLAQGSLIKSSVRL